MRTGNAVEGVNGVERGFDRAALLEAFHELGRRAYCVGRLIEISIYGGSALMLTFDWRTATRDVDALFEADKTFVRRLAAEIAAEMGWDENWLNDGVKGFLSAKDAGPDMKELLGTFPSEDQPGLRVLVAKPEYLFAMKCRAMRVGGVDENSDVDDIRRLAAEIGISSADEAFSLISEFYPANLLPPKTQFGLEDIFGAWNEGGRTGEEPNL